MIITRIAACLQANPDGTWKLVPVAPHVVTEPGLVLYRFGAELFYANAGRFLEEISQVVQPMPSAVKWVVVDAEAMTHLDYTAARIVQRLKKNLDRGWSGAGVCARAVGSEIRLRSPSRDRGDRAEPDLQPAARSDCGL